MEMYKLNLITFCLLVNICLAEAEDTNVVERHEKPTNLMIAAKKGNIKKFLKTLAKEDTLRDLDINEKNAIDYAIENDQTDKIKVALSAVILLSQKN